MEMIGYEVSWQDSYVLVRGQSGKDPGKQLLLVECLLEVSQERIHLRHMILFLLKIFP